MSITQWDSPLISSLKLSTNVLSLSSKFIPTKSVFTSMLSRVPVSACDEKATKATRMNVREYFMVFAVMPW
jgi:hypothetical protein